MCIYLGRQLDRQLDQQLERQKEFLMGKWWDQQLGQRMADWMA